MAIVAGLAAAAPAQAQQGNPPASQTDRRIALDIPPQDLNGAILAFADKAGIQVFFDSARVQGLRSNGVSGEFTVAEALTRILSGTGLTYRFTGTNAVALEKLPQAGEAAPGIIHLGPVRIEGESHEIPTPKTDRAATDRSHSYAARAATVASKGAASLQEIPQSVSVITRQRIDDQNIVSLEDALREATGVTAVTYNATTSYFQVRGYPAEVQFDGIPGESGNLQYAPQFDMAMFDRVEVLRGPSGLLQGQGSPAGTINLVRKRPHDSFGWAGSLMAGSWNNFHGDLDVTGPIDSAGRLRGRVVAAGEDRDYFTDKEHEKHGLLYGILEFDVTPSTTITASAAIQDQRSAPFSFGQSVYADGTFLNAPRSAYFGVDWANGRWNSREAYASIDQDLGGGWSAKASIDYRWGTQHYVYGYLDGPVNLDNSSDYWLQTNASENSWLGGDAYFTGPVTLFGRTHHLVFGANYSWREVTSLSGGGGTVVDDIYNIDIPEVNIPFGIRQNPHTEQYGVYGQARISLADPLTLVLGGRITNYSAKTRSGLPTFGAYRKNGEIDGHFTPSAGLVFDVLPQLTLYGSYATIFSSQTNMTFEGDLLKPRTGKQFELGTKSTLFNGALDASAAVFSVTDNGRAFNDPDHPNFYIAAGKVRSQGVEAEITGEPLPGWSVYAGYTYLRTKFLNDPTNQGQTFDLEEPRHTLKLWSTYRIGDVTEPGFQVGGGVRVMSKTTRGGPVQGAYAVVDGQIGYRLDEQWSATLSINNLFDKKYYTRVPAATFGFYGPPRNLTITLRKGF